MATPFLPSFLQNLVYPVTLTAIGLVGNAFILGGQIKDAKNDLGGQINEMKGEFKELKGDFKDLKAEFKDIKGDLKEVKHEITALTARQTKMELYDISVAKKLLRDCGKRK